MKGADKVICQAAAVLLLFAMTSAPAKAQMGGFGGGGGEEMMTQMAPMLEMMKANTPRYRVVAVTRSRNSPWQARRQATTTTGSSRLSTATCRSMMASRAERLGAWVAWVAAISAA